MKEEIKFKFNIPFSARKDLHEFVDSKNLPDCPSLPGNCAAELRGLGQPSSTEMRLTSHIPVNYLQESCSVRCFRWPTPWSPHNALRWAQQYTSQCSYRP